MNIWLRSPALLNDVFAELRVSLFSHFFFTALFPPFVFLCAADSLEIHSVDIKGRFAFERLFVLPRVRFCLTPALKFVWLQSSEVMSTGVCVFFCLRAAVISEGKAASMSEIEQLFSVQQHSRIFFFCQHLALKRGKWLSAASFFTSQWWDQYEKCGAAQKVWTRLSRSVRSYLSELVSLEFVVDLCLISAAGYILARLDPHIHCFYQASRFLSPYKTESIHKCQKSIWKRRNWPARDVQRVI